MMFSIGDNVEVTYKVGENYYFDEDEAYEASYRIILKELGITQDDLVFFDNYGSAVPLEESRSCWEDIALMEVKTQKGLDFFRQVCVDLAGTAPEEVDQCGAYRYDYNKWCWVSYEEEREEFVSKWEPIHTVGA